MILLLITLSVANSIVEIETEENKRFILFDNRVEAGSIIDVPVRCRRPFIRIGKRCRMVI